LNWCKVFLERFFSQQFKRSTLPDGVKIGSVCLSPRADWRMPSDARADVWLRELESIL
jgi:NAD+ synthase (glutamine-hydrolysing)